VNVKPHKFILCHFTTTPLWALERFCHFKSLIELQEILPKTQRMQADQRKTCNYCIDFVHFIMQLLQSLNSSMLFLSFSHYWDNLLFLIFAVAFSLSSWKHNIRHPAPTVCTV
jgi:hypothetical protein